MSENMLRRMRSAVTTVAFIGATAALGVFAGSIGAPSALAQPGCENDGCARVCFMGTCTGECFDSPGNGKKCDMQGNDCVVAGCS
jgi:hypothetical protein